ncbi:MAG: 2,4-dihydroxyhept-2-ene-1,7-dioic acid aldolase [Desulfobacterales bacterium]|nr:2,4-dihydroxyhept-2-ene-1,7-dioic acid aldolase [Desulfobacterales bacterium]
MTLKDKLKNHELTIGSWITIGHTIVAEIMAKAGYDWLTVDMEHSAISIDIAQDLIRVIDLCGLAPLVRVSENDPNLIKRVMDAGSHGVIVPMVNSKNDAEKAVASVQYPPSGFRGVGLARAQNYGFDFEGYKKWNEQESIVIVQIEHIKAVENLETILSVPGVDGFMIGPYDLSGSLGIPGQFDHPEMVKALKKVKEISKKMNALSGFHVISPDAEALQEKIRDGYKFIAHSLDILFFDNGCRNSLKAIRKNIDAL